MTSEKHELKVTEKIVVKFDMCSSSTIIEDLTLRNDLKPLRNLLIRTKEFLVNESSSTGFILYKFVGDGWILLFPPDIGGLELLTFLTRLSKRFKMKMEKKVLTMLDDVPAITGLTFGVDRGQLVKVVMDGRDEYLGRALNVACRLQEAIKKGDPAPQYKVLMSRPVFHGFSDDLSNYKPEESTKSLRNIKGGSSFRCVQLCLPIKRKR